MKKKRRVPPKVKITDAKNGVINIWTSNKTTKGIYELVLTGQDGKELVISRVEVI